MVSILKTKNEIFRNIKIDFQTIINRLSHIQKQNEQIEKNKKEMKLKDLNLKRDLSERNKPIKR